MFFNIWNFHGLQAAAIKIALMVYLSASAFWVSSAAVGDGLEVHSIQRQLIAFTNGPVVLHGLLMTPNPPTAHATVVMVHGSGPAARDSFGGLEGHLVRSGISVIVYDKRGVQDSNGDWKRASLGDLAGDALAAVNFATQRGARQVGLWGGSQGGWIAPIAAARSTNIHFIVTVAASGVSPGEQELFRQDLRWRASGLSNDQTSDLRAAWRLFYNFAATGQGAAALDKFIARIELDPVLDERRPEKSTELADDSVTRHLGFDFDPLPVWERVRCPVLALWGERDALVPVNKSIDLIRQALKRAGNTECTFKVFPGAQHGLTMSEKGHRLPDDSWESDWASGYIELLVNWLKQRDKS